MSAGRSQLQAGPPAQASRPRIAVPANACDCHMHLYDSRFAAVRGARLVPPDATLEQYRALQARLGTERTVCVTPSTYGFDNRCMLEAIAGLGASRKLARGVAVLDESVTDAELARLHAAGVRGVRFNLSLGVSSSAASLLPVAERIAPLGWHVQLILQPEGLLGLAPALRRLPVRVVLDHLGKIAPSQQGGAAHRLILELLAEDRAWVKLSGAYLVTEGASPGHEDVASLARSYIECAPHRLVWGSNWPHATASAGHHAWPDDAASLDQLAAWCGDESTFRQVLVDNPACLYDFGPAPIA